MICVESNYTIEMRLQKCFGPILCMPQQQVSNMVCSNSYVTIGTLQCCIHQFLALLTRLYLCIIYLNCPESLNKIYVFYRPVVPGCARCAMAHPDFGRSVNPISTRGDRLYPPNYYWHIQIVRPSDRPATSLSEIKMFQKCLN